MACVIPGWQFSMNQNGYITTKEGYYVLGQDGPVVLPREGDILISKQGDIVVDGQYIDRIRVVTFADTNLLLKEGDNLYLSEVPPIEQADMNNVEVVQVLWKRKLKYRYRNGRFNNCI